MSLQLTISAFLETSAFDAQTAERERRIRELLGGLQQIDEKTDESFNKVVRMMRGSYMIISGIARVMGPGFSRVFQSIWSVATSSIIIYTAIAKAKFFIPGQEITSLLMIAELVAAVVNMGALMTGQKDLARESRGVNFALHGISTMISSFSI